MDRRTFVASVVAGGSLELAPLLAAIERVGGADTAPADLGGGKPEDETFWQRVRDQFYVPGDVIYLNNGSLGLSPRPVVEALYRHVLDTEAMRNRTYGDYPWWGYGPSLEIRTKLAGFVGALPEEVALTRNATEGMNTVAVGLDLEPGDEVVLSDQEHPGGRSAWYQRAKRYGIVVREFPLPLPPRSPAEIVASLERALTPRTRVISVSHITTTTGGILPVKEICELARRRSIVTLIDGAHAIGQIPLDLHDLGCDYYAASPHKWLYAPKGTGLLYCRKGMAEKLWAHTATGAWDRRELACERLTNVGTSNYSLLIGLSAAIDFNRQIGTNLVAERGRYLSRTLREMLGRIDGGRILNGPPPELSGAMVKLGLPVAEIGNLANRMWDQHRIWIKTDVAAGPIPPSIRFALPIYIRRSDLERVVDLLRPEIAGLKRA
jgi:isopenicillin-N epimerase